MVIYFKGTKDFLDEFEGTRLSLLLTGTLATHFREQLNLLTGSKNFLRDQGSMYPFERLLRLVQLVLQENCWAIWHETN